MSYMNNQVRKGDIIYIPINPSKYRGSGKIVCRSSWEKIFCSWSDNNPAVVEWSSEPFGIPYIDKTSRDKKGLPKRRSYYPDFLCKITNSQGILDTWLIEVKPSSQCKPPSKRGNKSNKTMIYESKAWAVNQSKWQSAEQLCKKRGWKWKILTEKQLIKR